MTLKKGTSGYWTPRHIFKIALAWMVIIGVSVVATEVSLRSFHSLLPQPISNHLAHTYHTGLTGIYRWDPETKRAIMKPNFERDAYYNGYRWHHKTDWMGFRNPTGRSQTDVVLLGDSFVYGHGLEEADTIRHQLENIIKRPISNLGQQGASAHYEYHFLKDALRLKPQFVFLFFLSNDIHDLTEQLSDEEMRRFIAQQTDIRDIDYTTYSPLGFWGFLKFVVAEDLYTLRALEALLPLLRQKFSGEAHASPSDWEHLPLFSRNQRLSLAMAFHLDALKKMHSIARDNNITLVNVFIYTGHYAEEEPIYEQVLQHFCQAEHIPFLNLRPVFSQDNESEPLFLKNDGHFSSRGARVVAEILAAYLKSHSQAASHRPLLSAANRSR